MARGFRKDDNGRWVTTEKKHKVHINEGGEPDMGNPYVLAAMKGKGESSRGKTKLEKEAERFFKDLDDWKDVDFPEDNSEAVDHEKYEKQRMKEKLDRLSRLMHEEDPEAAGDDMTRQGRKKNSEGVLEKDVGSKEHGNDAGDKRKTSSSEQSERKYGQEKAKKSSSGGETRQNEEYEPIPYTIRAGGIKYASPDEVKQARETVSRFIKNAKKGDVYVVGGGFGSAGGQKFTVTESRGKPALAWIDKDGYARNPVQMSRSNVREFLGNGAKLVK